MFSVKVAYRGGEVNLTWDGGELSSDDEVALFEFRVFVSGQIGGVGPGGGPNTYENHLESPLSTWILMHRFFDEIIEATGDVPEIPDHPPGTVA